MYNCELTFLKRCYIIAQHLQCAIPSSWSKWNDVCTNCVYGLKMQNIPFLQYTEITGGLGKFLWDNKVMIFWGTNNVWHWHVIIQMITFELSITLCSFNFINVIFSLLAIFQSGSQTLQTTLCLSTEVRFIDSFKESTFCVITIIRLIYKTKIVYIWAIIRLPDKNLWKKCNLDDYCSCTYYSKTHVHDFYSGSK